MSGKNGWIKIGDERMPLQKHTEVVLRAKASNGHWCYQIGYVDDCGKVIVDPYATCSRCGGTLEWKPFAWNPFSTPVCEWKPLGKFIDADRRAASIKAEADVLYARALKAEELLYRFAMDQSKEAEAAIIDFVQDGLNREGL